METITNFRDLGGVKNRDGQVVAKKKLLRSGELTRVSPQDQNELLENYRLGKIIDLRSSQEIEERPDENFKNADYVHIDIFKNVEGQGTGLNDFKQIYSPDVARNYMHETYRTMAVNPSAQSGFRKMLESALSIDSDKSFLFHCFAGKDRTGISAALLLEILNVPREIIYKDYLKTNTMRVQENDEVIAQAIKNGTDSRTVEALKIALTVDSSYLDTFYQLINEEFGGIGHYLTDELEITSPMQKDLRSLYLASNN
ncbi:tyrosine-protein phosphatase [Tetragenococcus koreensis]|uniref:Protein tyrosine phosphatase n=1 Tax=Tetragenococcus koreensis TaxID=290335 RepID=A0AAN4ZTS6_9ENTE|nr:tyrosine-protein phosphatase [Tetragenococcus koreensis]AYW45112.1 protein-tyrosine-phosphatase [Tetragenococcus koreensis]MCF1584318.1 tyrosine-protein phosphatase [Tetragenococcus koreensis]MCF1613867.1 tyrosine-protein phosphatase [Tetragenococcus koreensis]MCF1616059.1 tyrosine-protein phosphatase [Tetragenococcus koreensis]MCF1618589.1 tyrosine-protein phosphatase [Tetragenococcus koreensis]